MQSLNHWLNSRQRALEHLQLTSLTLPTVPVAQHSLFQAHNRHSSFDLSLARFRFLWIYWNTVIRISLRLPHVVLFTSYGHEVARITFGTSTVPPVQSDTYGGTGKWTIRTLVERSGDNTRPQRLLLTSRHASRDRRNIQGLAEADDR